MATLYQLTDRWLAALDGAWTVVEETGEVFDPADIDEISADLDEKVENIACYLKNLSSDAEAIKAEEEALKARRQRLERHHDRLAAYLTEQLARAGKRRVETTRADVSLRRTKSVRIEDEMLVPQEFIKTTVKTAPDKRAIGYALKEGKAVPGCMLAEYDSLQVR